MDIQIDKIISKEKTAKYHRDFERVKKSAIRKKIVFLRIHFNRTLQSAYILLSSPFLLRRALTGGLKTLLGDHKVLRSLEVALTYRCNSRCEQCSCRLSFDPEREKKELLTLQEMENAIDQAVDMGAFQFCISGGEPMLEEEKVYHLTKYLKSKHKAYVHLCTNGLVLNEEKIKKLKELGLDSLEMGFDSAFEEIHDNNRVRNSYRKILSNIKLCNKYRIEVVLNTILTNQKVKSDDIIYTFHLAKKLGCMLQITPCCLTGALKNRLDLLLTDEGKLYFHWLLAQSWNNRSDLYSSLTKIKCPAAREKIGLQPYGDVVSCPLIQISYGNIRTEKLKDIQKKMLENPYYGLKAIEGCLPAMSEDFIRKYLLDHEMSVM